MMRQPKIVQIKTEQMIAVTLCIRTLLNNDMDTVLLMITKTLNKLFCFFVCFVILVYFLKIST